MAIPAAAGEALTGVQIEAALYRDGDWVCHESHCGLFRFATCDPRLRRESMLQVQVPAAMDLTSRLLALLGLEFDFSVSLHGEPFSQITETLYVGARPRPEDVPGLQDAGITHVVSCLEEAELQKLELHGLDVRTLGIAVRDGMDQDIAASFPQLFDFAACAADDPASRLLVHCEAGVSRSATLATALLMESERQTFLEAFARLRSKRPGVLPNIGFASQLQHLEHRLGPGRTASHELSSLARYLREVCCAPIEVELLQEFLEMHDYDAPRALRAIFGGEIPRVVQGVRF